MTDTYTPPAVWTWDKANGGQFANINRPIAGATHDKDLPVGQHPLQLYSLATPNGQKVTILLEELLAAGFSAAEYDAWLIRISDGDQFSSGFVAVNPNSKIPALMDHSVSPPQRVFESGAILLYLAEKSGRFMPKDGQARADAFSWLLWSMSGLGATLPQFHFFGDREAETAKPVLDRFYGETIRLFKVLEKRLSEKDYLAGEYSIADMPTYASTVGQMPNVKKKLGDRLGPTPAIDRWLAAIGARPAVQRGMKVPS